MAANRAEHSARNPEILRAVAGHLGQFGRDECTVLEAEQAAAARLKTSVDGFHRWLLTAISRDGWLECIVPSPVPGVTIGHHGERNAPLLRGTIRITSVGKAAARTAGAED